MLQIKQNTDMAVFKLEVDHVVINVYKIVVFCILIHFLDAFDVVTHVVKVL